MLWVMQGPTSRPTRDIDMLGQTSNEPEAILDQVQEITAAEVMDGGLHFDPDALKAETITEDADYPGAEGDLRRLSRQGQDTLPIQPDIGAFLKKRENVFELAVEFAASGRKWVA